MARPLLLLLATGLVPLAAGPSLAGGGTEARGGRVACTLLGGYTETVPSVLDVTGLKGLASYVVLHNQENFDKVLVKDPAARGRPDLLPPGAFDKKIVLGVIRRGSNAWRYQVSRVTASGETLSLHFTSASQFAGNNQVYISPLLVAVDRGKFTSVVFLDNGREVARRQVGELEKAPALPVIGKGGGPAGRPVAGRDKEGAAKKAEEARREAERERARPEDREKEAATQVKLAEFFINNRAPGKARERLQRVLRDYPETRAVGQARELLKKLGE
jgi:hypothetical protein